MNNILSIIIPCFNVEKYIGTTIDSLKRQKRQDVEFLFVNDGSTDGTEAVIEGFASSDNRVVIINQANSGVSSARNAALEVATGEYIYLLDGDDYLEDNAIEVMVGYLQSSQCDMLLSNIWIDRENHEVLYCHGFKEGVCAPYSLFCQNVVFPTSIKNVYKRSVIVEHNIRFNEQIMCGEVYEFTIHFLTYAHKIYVAADCFAHYVMRPASATHKINYISDRTILNMVEILYQYDVNFKEYLSFPMTAYKLIVAFTYVKYLRHGYCSSEISETIQMVVQNKTVRRCVKKVAYAFHLCWKERLLAWYILLSGEYGFRLAVKIHNVLYAK